MVIYTEDDRDLALLNKAKATFGSACALVALVLTIVLVVIYGVSIYVALIPDAAVCLYQLFSAVRWGMVVDEIAEQINKGR